MPVSIFASTNVPANRHGFAGDAPLTAGLIARGSGTATTRNPFSGQSIPAQFLEGTTAASIDVVRQILSLPPAGFFEIELGGGTRRDFLDAKEGDIGFAWQDSDGRTRKFKLEDVSGAGGVEPYRGTAQTNLNGLTGTLTVVIVDTTDANVDWANLTFADDNQSSDESDSLQLTHTARAAGDPRVGSNVSDPLQLTHAVRAVDPVEVEGANVSAALQLTHAVRAPQPLKVGAFVSGSLQLSQAQRSAAETGVLGIGIDSDSVQSTHEVRDRNEATTAAWSDGTVAAWDDTDAAWIPEGGSGILETQNSRVQLQHSVRAGADLKLGAFVSTSLQLSHIARAAGDPGVGVDKSASVQFVHEARAAGDPGVGVDKSASTRLTHDARAANDQVVVVGAHVSVAAPPQRTHAVRASAASALGVGLDSDSVQLTHEVRAPDAVGVGDYVSGALRLTHAVRAPTDQIIELATDESHSLQITHEARSVPTSTILLGIGVHVSGSLRLTHSLVTTTEDLPLVYDYPPIEHEYTSVRLRGEFASLPRDPEPWVEGEQTIKIKRRTAERSEVSVTMLMHTGPNFRSLRPVRGDSFEIRTGNQEVLEQVEADGLERLDTGEYPLFKGKVLTAPWSIMPGGKLARIQVRAQSLMARLDEIRIRPRWVSPAGALNTVLPKLLSRFVPASEGITWPTATLTDAGVVNETVHDHNTVADAIETLVEQAGGGVFGVDAFGRVYSRPRNSVQNTTVVLDKDTVLDDSVSGADDVQHHQTVTTVIGATVQAGEKREDFYGDGATTRWRLRFRISRIKSVSLDGVEQATSGEGARFTIDTDTGWISDGGSNPLTGDGESGQLLSVLYDWNFPIVETVESSAGIARYGRIHKVTQDAAADTIERGQDRAQAINRRHDNPTSLMRMSTIPGAVQLMRESTIAVVNLPELGIGNERWLVDGVDHTIVFGAEEAHLFDLDLLLRDHESSSRAYWRRGGRIVVPTQPEVGQLVTAGDGEEVDPAVIVQEGLRLPKPLGGRDTARYYGSVWKDIPGYADAVLDAQRLPSNLVEWSAMAKMAGPNQSGQVRLINANTRAQVGGAVTVTSVAPVVVAVRRITLTPNRNRYRLQHRYASGPTTGRGRGISTWAGNIDVGS